MADRDLGRRITVPVLRADDGPDGPGDDTPPPAQPE